MEVHLRIVEEREAARALAPRLNELATAQQREFRDSAYPEGAAEAFLAEEFDAPETVLLVAESAAGEGDLGLCLVGPFIDPLTRERVPTILLLHVESKARHRGLAKAMVEEAWARVSERGAKRFGGRVGHNDDALISMGERWGFTRRWEWIERES